MLVVMIAAVALSGLPSAANAQLSAMANKTVIVPNGTGVTHVYIASNGRIYSINPAAVRGWGGEYEIGKTLRNHSKARCGGRVCNEDSEDTASLSGSTLALTSRFALPSGVHVTSTLTIVFSGDTCTASWSQTEPAQFANTTPAKSCRIVAGRHL
jgi:hypothetical protein